MFGKMFSIITLVAVIASGLFILLPDAGSAGESDWKPLNAKLIGKYDIKGRTRNDIPETGIYPNPEPGEITSIGSLPEIELVPDAKARICWGKGVLVNRMTIAPGAEIPRETLPGERIMIVLNGSVNQLINGSFVTMIGYEYERMTPISGRRGRMDFVYLEKGAESALKAGKEGAEIIEVYHPVRTDYLKKAGITYIPRTVGTDNYETEPSIRPNRIYNYYDIQFTQLYPGADARLISGRGMQLSFLRMDSGSEYSPGFHPEEQLRIVLRGDIDETVLDSTHQLEKDNVLYLPGSMVHGNTTGSKGCDVLDVFWPVRPDFTESMKKGLKAYHKIIPEEASIELVVDGAVEGPGLCYIEGPSWINGKLYFSSMHYDDRWNGDPSKSATVEMDPDGTYRYIATGMETNGTFPLENGNLAVCDTFEHRVIEMTTKGEVVRILASEYDGKRLDGPNDIAVDNKGGIYFTDPQIMPPPHMQPGRSVFYRKPNGNIIRVMAPGVLEKPNGLILSPDCKTLYVNSTPENFMMAYDINEDDSVSNMRKFGKIRLTPEILDSESINPQVDGMTVDERGNIYITSILGLQIFSPAGDF
ncbi:MAG: SMP-30/gluconolactonase/LRE family protein, partial [Candidatus Latescibacteria bacterium]|nr:SMP-30/gluconolactonase/LRE family protein [Candidatus Latescibacterota bacterium]